MPHFSLGNLSRRVSDKENWTQMKRKSCNSEQNSKSERNASKNKAIPSFGINVISRKGPTISGKSLILFPPKKRTLI